jgi:hypothetical protein
MAINDEFFYNNLIRKYILTLGSLIDNLQVSRKDSQGVEQSRERVPVTYAQKEKYFYKLKRDLDLEDRGPAIKLPRISYELIAMDYAPQRKMMSGRSICLEDDAGGKPKTYAPVPYNLTFQVMIYSKSLDEMHQIIEQIIPYFAPEFTVCINPIDGVNVEQVIPVTLNSIVPSDTYEGTFDDRRLIIWTLTFTMPVEFWGRVRDNGNAGIIYGVQTNVLDLDGNLLFGTIQEPYQVSSPALPPDQINPEEPWEVNKICYDALDSPPTFP